MLSALSSTPAINRSTVSMTPAINCSPVSTTPPINFFAPAIYCSDNRGLFFLQNYLQPPKSATATDIVIGTAMKRRKGTWHTLIRGPWGRQNYFKPKRHYLVLVASEASDQDVCGVHGCNFSWRFQWHHRRPFPTSTAGDIADFSPSTFSYPWQLPTSMASLFLSLAINLSPVSLSTAIIVHRCRCHRRYINRRYKRHWRSLKIHDKDQSPVSLTPAINFSPVSLTPVINIHSQISLRIFEKIQNGPNGILGGPGDTDSWKKLEVKNLVSDSL